jgi:hypothetical protein
MDDHIKKILSKTSYIMNEATFSLVDNLEEDDTIPDEVYTEPKPVTAGDSTVFEAGEETPPEGEIPPPEGDVPPIDGEVPAEDPLAPEVAPEMAAEPQQTPDQVQNDILKLNISAMAKMQNVINDLDLTIEKLNMKVNAYGAEVEEVREPTNVEKLVAKKEDSHPYNYNLNDLWNGNSFQARMEVENKGITQLEDGTYEANFDDIAKHTDQEVMHSFKI